jgi:chaperonin GroEL
MIRTKQSAQTRVRRPAVVFQPNLLEGINLIADVIKPTLGPLPRTVAIENTTHRDRTPEVLDNAGVIARRIIQVGGDTRDAGAMMLRHAIWRMHETCGDGAATAAVLAQAISQHAMKALAAGTHPALLKRGLELGVEQAEASLRAQIIPFPGGKAGRTLLANLARTLCPDKELADVLVEIIEITGAEGAVHVINSDARKIDREYVEGAMWESPWLTSGFATDAAQHIGRIEDASVILLDGKLDTAQHVLAGLKRLHDLERRNLIIIAGDMADDAKNIFIQAKLSGAFRILPIKAPAHDAKRAVALGDIAALTGARVLIGDGSVFGQVSEGDLGFVRRAWATSKQFGLIGGQRDPIALRTSIAAVRRKIDETENLDDIAELRLRLARLSGGLAIVRVGAATNKIQEERKEQATRLSRALQMATRRGMVAGGGAAFLRASEALSTTDQSLDIAFGVRCVKLGLEAPMSVIAANAGHDPSNILARARVATRAAKGGPHGLDARTGALVDMAQAGIVDSVETLTRALHIAGSLAGMAATTDAVIHHRKPATSAMP